MKKKRSNMKNRPGENRSVVESSVARRNEAEIPPGAPTNNPADELIDSTAPIANQNPTGIETEVLEQAKRRRFPASYKLKIVQEADRLSGTGEIGAMLRREGIYASQLAKWRKLRDEGSLTGLSGKKRGPKPVEAGPVIKENLRLKRENERLQKKLRKAEMLIDLQKKVAALLEEDERTGGA